MIPTHADRNFPHITGRDRFKDGRRGHARAGLLGTTAMYPVWPMMRLYKGGGGFKSIIVSIAVGAALGAITGGIGFAMNGAFGLTFSAAATLGEAMAAGAIMGAIGGALTGTLAAFAGGGKKDEAESVTNETRDNKLTVRNSTGPRKKIYGTALAGGLMVYATSTGSTHEYFHSVNTIASHQVQAIREVFFNNNPESNSRFSGYYRLKKHLGTQTQAADADLVAEAGGEWTASHRLRETAYIYPRIKYDTNAWVSGIPSTSVMVDGALLYDPRSTHVAMTGSAAGSPGVFTTATAHGFQAGDAVFLRNHAGATYAAPNGLHKPVAKRYTVNTVPSATTFTLLNDSGEPMPVLTPGAGGDVAKCGWSNNWALAVLDYLLSRDGINAKTSEIDWAFWEDAADTSDEDVALGREQTFTASATANTLTLSGAVGWQTGMEVTVSSDGTLPDPLEEATAYYWIRGEDSEDSSTGKVAATYADAISNTAIDLTDAGSGTHTIAVSSAVTVSASADTVTLPNLQTVIETGDCVTLSDAPQVVVRQPYSTTTTLTGPGTFTEHDLRCEFVLGEGYFWYRISTGATVATGQNYDVTTTAPALTMVKVSGTPAAGQFAYSDGVYTFSSADAGRSVKIGGGDVQAIPVGLTITVTNPHAGQDFYWFNTGYLTGKLATSRANALANVAVDLLIDGAARLIRKSQARYTINGIIDLSKKPIDILNELLTAGGGVMVYTQGKYRLFAAAPASSVRALTQDDLRGSINILPHTSRQSLINAVRGTYKEPAKYWEMTDFPPLTNATYEAEDGGQRLYKDIALPHTIDPQRAQRIASIALGRARRGMTINFPATVKMLGISAWDCVTLDINAGVNSIIAGRKFRVTSWALSEDAQGVDLVLQEEDDAVYQWNAYQGAIVPQNDLSGLPDPWNVAAPSNLALTSGTDELLVLGDGTVTSRIRAAWTDPNDATITRIEVQAKPSSSEAWEQFTPVLMGAGQAYINPVTDGESWDVRVRAINSLGARSAWTTATGHVVVGKTAPPSDPANLYLTNGNIVWQQPTRDRDLAGWRVRHLAGRSRNWAQGADYPADGSPVTVPSVPASAFGAGTQTIMVRAVDSSGNLSDGTLYLTLGLGEAAPENVIVTYDDAAAGFAGTITGGAVVGGELVADSAGSLYLPDDAALYLPIAGATYLPGSWRQLVYDLTYVPAYADAPGRLMLDADVSADGWQVLYRKRGAGLYLQYDDDAYLPADGPYLGGVQPYSAWPGEVAFNDREVIDFRIVAEAGSRRGTVSALSVKIDVPDVTESFQDVSIAVGGTRLPITKTYRVVDYVGEIAIQDTGTGAVQVVVMDKNPTLGPLLKAVNSSGTSVSAVIDVKDMKGH